MANAYRNIPIHGLIDILGEQPENCKTCSGKVILVGKRAFKDGGEDPQAKRTYLDALRKAATYATFARKQELYVNKARDKGVTAYSIAINDWFSVPRVLLVNIDTWTGKPGQTIRIKARDHVRVTRINVVIRDAQGNVLESGEALPSRTGNIWWKYITKTRVTMTPLPRVEVTAHDLAGNQDTFITC